MTPLQIFEKHPTADAYRVGGFYSPYALVSTDKRFTEAELAAEYHKAELHCWARRSRCDSNPGEDALWDQYERCIEQSWQLRRFATLPHFDA